jgi:hypothetical protein
MPGEKRLDVDKLRLVTNEVIAAITSPAFVEAVRAVREVPADQRLVEGSRRLSPDALRAAGVPLPQNFRVSSRYFEDGLPGPINFGDDPTGRPNVVNEMNRAEPGALDRLRANEPELFAQLVAPAIADGDSAGRRPPGMGPIVAGGCACGGIPAACGGTGWTN